MPETFHLQDKEGKNYQVTAESREEAIQKVQLHLNKGKPDVPPEPQGQPAVSADGVELGVIPENESAPVDPNAPPPQTFVGSAIDGAVGLGETALTIGSGAIAAPLAGLRGLGTLLVTGDADRAASKVAAWQDAVTFQPSSEAGKQILQTVAEPLMWLDTQAKDISETYSFGSPMAATAIYTGLMGAADIAGINKARALRDASRVTIGRGAPGDFAAGVPLVRGVETAKTRVSRVAESLGVQLKQSDMAASVVRSARDAVPSERGANAAGYQAALREAKDASDAATAQKVANAQSREATLRTAEVKKFAENAAAGLIDEKYDLANMPAIQRRLEDLKVIEEVSPLSGPRAGVIPEGGSQLIELPPHIVRSINDGAKPKAATLNEMMRIRDRIDKDILKAPTDPNLPPGLREGDALVHMRNQLDDFIDQQFTQDMIGGDPSGVAAWKQANEARQSHNARWNSDKQIVNLMKEGADPAAISRFLIGASSVGSKPQAVATIRRMKELLGKDHPAIGGIATDFLHEMVSPLLKEPPNFKQFIARHAETNRVNGHLMRELGIDKGRVDDLVAFAKVADNLGPNSVGAALLHALPKTISRLWVGHGIAKAGVKVGLMTSAIRMLTGRDRVSRQAIIAEALGVMGNTPVFRPGQVAASRAIEAAFWANIGESVPDEEVEQ